MLLESVKESIAKSQGPPCAHPSLQRVPFDYHDKYMIIIMIRIVAYKICRTAPFPLFQYHYLVSPTYIATHAVGLAWPLMGFPLCSHHL